MKQFLLTILSSRTIRMSNPAVITLANASNRTGNIKRLVVEDNIGESIHIHVDDMRLDFSVQEFLAFSDEVVGSLESLDILDGISLYAFDEHFIFSCSKFLVDLKAVKIETIKLSEVKCITAKRLRHDLVINRHVKLKDTPAYKYLQGDETEFSQYPQFNYHGINNEDRLQGIIESIKTNGYPFEGKYITLFDGENIIRDGQHRAAALATVMGLDAEVTVFRFYFRGRKHTVRTRRDNLKRVLIWSAFKLYKVDMVRKIYRRLKSFIN